MHCESRMFGVLIATSLLGACTALPWTHTQTVEPSAVDAPVERAAVAARSTEPTDVVAAADSDPRGAVVSSTVRPAVPGAPVPRIAVVISAGIPAFDELVAEILQHGANRMTIHPVVDDATATARLIAELETEKPDRIIAVGLPAAIAARSFESVPMVFCEIFNYQDYDLVSETSKGVYLLPPFALQLEAWRQLAPGLERIGVVTGPGHDALIDEMREAVKPSGIELSTRIVRTDREALHAFKELAPDIEGLWLLPDNRILSPDVVREILSYSAEHGKQVATFGESLLKMGALLSLTSDARDVVERVFDRLEAVDANGRLPGPDMLPLTTVRTRINYGVAKQLGLTAQASAANGR